MSGADEDPIAEAAPEPIASRHRYYTDSQLAALARTAGFADVAVRNEGGGQLLTATAPSATERPG